MVGPDPPGKVVYGSAEIASREGVATRPYFSDGGLAMDGRQRRRRSGHQRWAVCSSERTTQARALREPWALRYSLLVVLVGATAAGGAFALTYRWVAGTDVERLDAGIKTATTTAAVAAGVLTWGRLELSRREHGPPVTRT